MTHTESRERRYFMAEDIRDGDEIGTVAKKFNVTQNTVREACREYGVDIVPRERDIGHRTLFILSNIMKNPNKPLAKIAQDLNLSKQRVSAIYQEALKIEFPGLKKRGKENGEL